METPARRPSLSLNNFDSIQKANVKKAQAKRQRAIDYGNSASNASKREADLKELKKQVGATRRGGAMRAGRLQRNVPWNGKSLDTLLNLFRVLYRI